MKGVILRDKKGLKKAIEKARRDGKDEILLVIFIDGTWDTRDSGSRYLNEVKAVGIVSLDGDDFNVDEIIAEAEQSMYENF